MPNDTVSDADAGSLVERAPDPHGQAAMLLVESLIHGLIERNVLSVAEAVEIIEVAEAIEIEIIDEQGQASSGATKSTQLLRAMSVSLKPDIPKK